MTITRMSDFKEFPATDVLGYSLDFTTASPMDIKSVLASIRRGRRILQYEPDEDTRKLEVGDVIYDVPRVIGVSTFNQSDGTYVTYTNGVEASSSLKVDTSLSARYLAVSASASVSYAIDKTYRREDQWAMYSFNADTYLASMRDYYDLLAETALLRRLEEAVPIGNGSNKEVLQDWKDFFNSWGSHVIINSSYGARFQLNVWASNSNSSVNERFSTSVTASFNGIGFGGSFDASVKTEEQYKTFSEFMQKQVSVMGGNLRLNTQLAADPTHYDRFIDWAGSVAEDSTTVTLRVIELWVLMKEASRKQIRDMAGMVMDAYNFIVTHTQVYKTAVVFDIQTDWGEFNLLSPSAVIVPDLDHPFPVDNMAVSNTRVRWGREHSHNFDRMTLRFFIINDGSPIDFSISRGSRGNQSGGTGRAEALIEGLSYLNDENTDGWWNTMWFYQKGVSSNVVPTSLKLARTSHTWDDILKEYLEETGASDWL